MFALLKRKLYIIAAVVALILLILNVMVYYTVKNLLGSDFTGKTIDFSKQIAKDAEIKLGHIQYTSGLFLRRAGIMDDMDDDSFYAVASQKLGEIGSFNADTPGAAIFLFDGATYSSNSAYLDLRDEIVGTETDRTKAETRWIIVENKSRAGFSKMQSLFYVLPLLGDDGAALGYFAAEVLPDTALRNLNTDNIFLKDCSMWFSSNEKYLRIMGDADESNLSDISPDAGADYVKDEVLFLRNPLWEGDAELVFVLPMETIHDHLNSAKTYLIVFSVLINILCFLAVRRLTNGVIADIMYLKNKMDEYVATHTISG